MWYAELFVGRDDCDWDYLRCVYREDAGDYECGAGFVKRGSHIVYYDDGRYVLLGWDDGNCIGSRGGEKYVPQDAAGNPISISGYSGKSPIYGAYYDKYYCQCTGAWVGGDACRIKGDGGTWETGGGQKGRKASGASEEAWNCQ